jgi:hypothetical protein
VSDPATAYLFRQIFRLIDDHVAGPAARQREALKFWALMRDGRYDFKPHEIDADDVLMNLGLARLGTRGEAGIVYGPVKP